MRQSPNQFPLHLKCSGTLEYLITITSYKNAFPGFCYAFLTYKSTELGRPSSSMGCCFLKTVDNPKKHQFLKPFLVIEISDLVRGKPSTDSLQRFLGLHNAHDPLIPIHYLSTTFQYMQKSQEHSWLLHNFCQILS